MKHITYGVLVAATVLLACQQVSDSAMETDLSAIKSQLGDIEEVFLNTKVPIATQLHEYLEFFVDDAVLLPPGEDAVQGYDAALAFYTEGFEGGTVLAIDYHTHVPEIFVQGDLAIRRYIGSSEVKFDGEHENYSSYNRYIDILQRQPDGEWRVICHAWTPIDQ